jgi:UDP-N-acetyl-D-glucosamine dehydrogenase
LDAPVRLEQMPTSLEQKVDEERLRSLILCQEARVVVLGQGYVGLTVAGAAAAAGFCVAGLDVDVDRIAALDRGELLVPGVDEGIFREGVGSERLTFTVDASVIAEAEVIVVCVPTPLREHAPDLSHVEEACADVARHVRGGSIVILESSTYPGTTEELVRGILETSGLAVGQDLLLAYSPERIDPGNGEFGLRNTPKIVAGVDRPSLEIAVAFYEQLVDKVVPVSSARVGETAKLFENTFRHVNIALVNELAMLCHELDIDIWEVLDAAATKPFGFMAFQPGPGIGGHCIPLDPAYLSWKIRRESGRRFGLLDLAEDINDRMPEHVAARVAEILNGNGRAMKSAKVLVLGVAYKPDVGDVRESPALRAMLAMLKRGADVMFHDPYVERVPLNGGTLDRTEMDEGVRSADIVVLLTPHSTYDLQALAERAKLIFDTRNAYRGERPPNVIAL